MECGVIILSFYYKHRYLWNLKKEYMWPRTPIWVLFMIKLSTKIVVDVWHKCAVRQTRVKFFTQGKEKKEKWKGASWLLSLIIVLCI
jgi:hypothetical protein